MVCVRESKITRYTYHFYYFETFTEYPYLFDISIFAKLTNPDLIEQIEKTGVVLYRREENTFVAEDNNPL